MGTSGRVSLSTSVICSVEFTTRKKEGKHARNARTKCRLAGVAPVMCPVAFFVQAAKYLSDVAV